MPGGAECTIRKRASNMTRNNHGEAFGREIHYGGHVLQARAVRHDIDLDVYAVEHLVVGEIRLHRLAADLVCDLLRGVAVQV
jgi:hypothetical protein